MANAATTTEKFLKALNKEKSIDSSGQKQYKKASAQADIELAVK